MVFRNYLLVFSIVSLSIGSCSKKEVPVYSDKIEVITLAETSKMWNGEALPNYHEGTPKVTILKVIIPPKSKLELHKHLVINAGVLIKGNLTVVDEHGNTKELKEGEGLVELVNTYHYGENKGDVLLRLL